MYHCRPDIADGPGGANDADDVVTPPPCGRRRASAALGALFLAAFVVGTAELMMVGVLPLISDDLDVPIGTAGALVSSYALGIAIGGPVLTFATMRLPGTRWPRGSWLCCSRASWPWAASSRR